MAGMTKTYKDLKALFESIPNLQPLPTRGQVREMRDRKFISTPRGLQERSPAQFTFRDVIGISVSLMVSRHEFSVENTGEILKLFFVELEKAIGSKEITAEKVKEKWDALIPLRCFIQDDIYVHFGPETRGMELMVRTDKAAKSGMKVVYWTNILNVGELVTLLARRWLKQN